MSLTLYLRAESFQELYLGHIAVYTYNKLMWINKN